MDLNEQRHLELLATNPEYRLMEQVGVTPWRWDLYLARKRLRNAMFAMLSWPVLRRLIK